jgi:hypothetical protein
MNVRRRFIDSRKIVLEPRSPRRTRVRSRILVRPSFPDAYRARVSLPSVRRPFQENSKNDKQLTQL